MKKLFTLLSLMAFMGANILTADLAKAATSGLVQDQEDFNAFPDGVYYDYLIDEDETAAAADTTVDDVDLPIGYSETLGSSYLYVGSITVFDGILFDISTPSSAVRVCTSACKYYQLEYFNGVTRAWENLDYTDSTNNLKDSGVGAWEFSVPSAWDDDMNTKLTVDGKTLYWVRLSAYSTTTISTEGEAEAIALRAYNYQVELTNELGADISDFLSNSTYSVSAGTSNEIAGAREKVDGVYQFALDAGLSDSNYDLTVDMDGYIEETWSTGLVATTLKSVSNSLVYTHKIDVQGTDGNPLNPVSVKANVSSPSTAAITCILSSHYAYCPLTVEQDSSSTTVTVEKNGYDTKTVTLSSDRTDASDAQVTTIVSLEESVNPSSSIGYVSIDVGNEDGDDFDALSQSNFTVTGGSDNTIYGFTNNNNGNYILQLATGNSDYDYNITVTRDGFVQKSVATGSIGTGTTNVNFTMQFAYRVRVQNEDGDNITYANVQAGDGLDVECDYIADGYYGCPVLLADTSTTFRVSASGYNIEYDSFYSDRDDQADAQMTSNVELELKDPGTECEVPFDDIYGHWVEPYVEELYCRGVVQGLDSNTYGPGNDASRAEFLKIALLNAGIEIDGSGEEDFDDVSSGDWFYEYVKYGVEEGYIEGYADGTFKPNNPINRAEALVILMRIAGVDEHDVDQNDIDFGDVDADDWFAYAVVDATEEGIVEGYEDNTFRPVNNISRAEVAAMAVRTHDAYYE